MGVTSQIVKKDGEYYVIIPNEVSDAAGFNTGDNIDIKAQDGAIVVTKLEIDK
ncbi:AbrB/MazE/SpoVT family DNA-binding domain-containing protein [Bacillus massiliigorillae]|uniref:AbrB/MazE/SpoVT family DNA-binding domain-containing protein n=1 Tax=Bacillus massiliigorillae TaxID=1243664 RepID=UPI00039A5B42|nr:hypothetical protein [Bacillus massiliigorillae]